MQRQRLQEQPEPEIITYEKRTTRSHTQRRVIKDSSSESSQEEVDEFKPRVTTSKRSTPKRPKKQSDSDDEQMSSSDESSLVEEPATKRQKIDNCKGEAKKNLDDKLGMSEEARKRFLEMERMLFK